MNTIYNVVWNSTTNTWVVASEMAKGKKKSSRSAAAALAAAGLVVSSVVVAHPDVDVPGESGLEICQNGVNNGINTAGCALGTDGWGLFTTYGAGFTGGEPAYITGKQTGELTLHGAKGITMMDDVLMSGKQIRGLAPGVVGAGSTDAVTGDQVFNATKYFKAVGGGADAQATAATSVAVGAGSKASQQNANAVGASSTASGVDSNAFGTGASATKAHAIAIGAGSVAEGLEAIAIGSGAVSRQTNGTAVGNGAETKGENAAAFGAATEAFGLRASAVGFGAKALDVDASAFGNNAEARSIDSTAIGDTAKATATGAQAFGTWSEASGQNATAVGLLAQAQAKNAAAMGVRAKATAEDSIALGTTSEASGVDASAFGSEAKATGEFSSAVGTSSTASGTNASAFGSQTNASAANATALGNRANATARESTAVGYQTTASGVQSAALGERAVAGSDYSIAIGSESQTQGMYGTAVGVLSKAGQQSLALGDSAGSSAMQGVAIGSLSRANEDFAVAIGADSDAATSGTAIGRQAKASADSVALGAGSVADRARSVSVGTAGSERQITNLAKGTADTDGVNVSQLKGVTTAIGGGSTVNIDGSIKAPEFNVGGKTVNNVGEAIDGLDNIVKESGLVDPVTGKAQKAVTFNGPNGEANVAGQKIINVAAGTADTDGVNVKQLKDSGLIDPTTGKTQKAVLFNGPNGEANSAGQKFVNLAKGTADTDGVNVSQLKGVTDVIGAGAGINPDGTVKAPEFNVGDKKVGTVGEAIDGLDNIVKESGLVDPTTGKAQKAVLFNGPNGEANVAGQKIINVGDGALSANSKDAVNGSQLFATNQNVGAVQNTVNNITNGAGIKYFHTNSKLADSQAGGTDAIAVGGGASAGANRGIAIGTNANASAENSIALGTNSVGDRANSISLGSANNQRQIINLAKGTADTDGVNVSQLKGVTDAIGGGAGVNPDGTVKKPTITVGGSDYDNVGAAIAAVDAKAGAGNPLGVNYDSAAKDKVTLNNGGAPVTIGNVKDGVADNDAVNVSQLKQTGLIDPDTGKAQKAVLFNGPNAEANVAGTKIVNVGAGTANTDGVNIGQLKPVIDGLGGGAKIDPATGAVTGPTYVITNPDGSTTTVNNAGDAITNISNNITNGTVGLVQQAGKGQRLTVGKATDGTEVNFTGTAGDRKLTGVAKGTADTDAVNVSQLKDAGLIDPDTGKAQKAVLFNGPNGEANVAGTKIVNVAAGTANTDAVNLSQLKGVTDVIGAGAGVNPDGTIKKPTINVGGKDFSTIGEAFAAVDAKATTGNPLGVAYDSAAKDKVTLNNGGAPVTIGNVKDGVADNDAVNVSQLKETGLIDPDTGKAQKAVLFNGPNAEANVAGTKVVNVAEGTVSAASKDAINGSQLFGTAQSVAKTIGGGSVVNPDGTIKAPEFTVGGKKIDNVGAAIDGLDKIATESGLIDPTTGKAQKAVLFNGPNGEANVAGTKIVNVAAGTGNTDAVNIAQLKPVIDGLGGGAKIDPTTGAVTGPTYVITNPDGTTTTVNNAGDAITNVTNNITNGTVGLVQQAAKGQKLTVGKATDGAEVNFTGTAGDRKLTGVAKGTADTDAVNVSQLKESGLVDPTTGKAQKAVLFNGPNGEANVAGTKIVNVGAGTVSAASTDAINGSQLFGVSKSVSESLGGGSKVNPDGSITGPTYVITKPDGSTTTVNNVGDAITNITNNISSGTVGLVQQAAKGDKLTVGKATDGREVDFTGTSGDRKLSGVANDTAGNNAVNVSQLKPIIDGMGGGAKIDPTTGTVTGPTYVVTNPDGTTTTVNNAGDAITHVDGRVTNITNNISNGTLGLVQQAAKGEKLTVGKATDGTEVNFTGTAGDRKLTGIAKGTADTDAVNVSQLKGTGLIDPVTGEAQKAVTFNGPNGEANVAGQKIINVAAGTADTDAVNVKQLKDTGLIDPTTGKAQKAVLFNGPNGEANVAGTKIVDVAAGTVAANSKDAINGGQLFGTAQSVAGALGGGSKVNPDGTITNPTYTVHKADGSSTTVNNVGDAITNVDGRVTNITNTINNGGIGLVQQAGKGQALTVGKDTDGAEVNFTGTAGDRKLSGVAKGTADNDAVNVSQLKEAGLVDGDGKVANVVTYDSADKDSVTLGGKNPGKKVKLKNVADATADDEAVNLGQLKGAGLVDGNGKSLDAVVYDAGSQKGAVTFGGANGTVLNNVADGRIESGSRQAINGGQIAALKDQLQGHITNIDGRVTKIEQNGGIGGTPDFVKAQGSDAPAPRGEPAAVAAENGAALGYNATAGAKGATAVGDGAKAMATDGVAVGSKARVEEPATNSVALGSGSVADRANTVSVGSAGQTRAITNVAAGTADHDAVNVTQLNQRLADANRYTDKAVDDVWNNLTHEIDEANTQANRGIAAASALINVTPYLPGRTAVNAGVASYRGETALGVGVSRWSENGRVNLNAGVSAAQGDEPVFRVGVGYVF